MEEEEEDDDDDDDDDECKESKVLPPPKIFTVPPETPYIYRYGSHSILLKTKFQHMFI